AGINGEGLFDPAEHGMKPVGISTACWRGFVCAYRVEDQALILDNLSVHLAGSAPDLFGIRPNQFEAGVNYEDLSHKVPYTGGLLIAREFIKELYVHMGFHPAWKYREVHELVFENGTLIQQADRSDEMAELRHRIA